MNRRRAALLGIGLMAVLLLVLLRPTEMDSPPPWEHLVMFGQPGGLEDSAWDTWIVMGTSANAAIWHRDRSHLGEALGVVRTATLLVDSLMSTYRDDSEISVVNRRAGSGTPTRVSAHTMTVIDRALEVGAASGGRLDITIGPLVDTWSFYVSWRGEQVPPPPGASIDSALALVGQHHIQVDTTARTVSLDEEGLRIDLGSLAKGYALDVAASVLTRGGIERAYLELGGQVLLIGLPDSGERWRIGIRHPRSPGQLAAVVSVGEGSLATSGDYERFFEWEGTRYFHILDPTTGRPARGVVSCTVWAPTGTDADAWSTVMFVAGPEDGQALLDAHPGLGVLWILDPGDEPLAPRHFAVAGTLRDFTELLPGY